MCIRDRSRDVSPEQKKKIRELFHPYIIADEDIVTGKDLNGYLGSNDSGYAQAEEKYYKLWIQNTDVLKRTIRDAVNGELLAESRLEWEKAKPFSFPSPLCRCNIAFPEISVKLSEVCPSSSMTTVLCKE